MIAKLLKSRRVPPPVAAIPDGARVYAVGDVHGRLDLLDDLLSRIDADDAARGEAETTIIFLGDLVDRGPDSAGVVERLRALNEIRGGLRFLMGNHEEIFMAALRGSEKAVRLFCRVGGRETIMSYGIEAEHYERMHYDDVISALQDAVPSTHVEFLSGFEDKIAIGDYIFVHAGVRPGVAFEDQVGSDLRWIREPFLAASGNLPGRVVHGHTIADEPQVLASRIGIDTGAYATGLLTAVGLEGTDVWVLQTSDQAS